MRVVSLACSNTEIVCALGCADWLVGVDDHSDTPADVISRLPKVGPDLQIDMEKVAALQPDLVIASLTVPGHENNIAALEKAGLPFIAPEPVSLADVYDDIYTIAHALGVPERAEAVVKDMKAVIPDIPETPNADGPSILVEWWPKPVIAPGKQSWVTDLIHAAGGRNPIGLEDVKSRPMTDEEVLTLSPDAFVISWCGVKVEKYRPDVIYRKELWHELPALQNKRVYCIAENYLGRPSPQLVEGYRALRKIIKELGEVG